VTCELLQSLGVPTAAIVDFDILRTSVGVKDLLNALGTDDGELDSLCSSVVAQLSDLAKGQAFTKDQFLRQISDLLSSVPDSEPVSRTKLREVTDLLRNSVDWAALKKHGVAETSGSLNTSLFQLLSGLASRRLHVVPVGELERMV
jgi:hypothetical protein